MLKKPHLEVLVKDNELLNNQMAHDIWQNNNGYDRNRRDCCH